MDVIRGASRGRLARTAVVLGLFVLAPAAPTHVGASVLAEGTSTPVGGSLLIWRYTPFGGGLYAIDPRGQRLKLVLPQASSARWSPDGKLLAFSKGIPCPGTTPRFSMDEGTWCSYDIDVVTSSGTGLRTLVANVAAVPGPGPSLSWSPDGRRLAYVAPSHEPDTIVVVNVKDHSKRSLAQGDDPEWSPDGRRIAFIRDFHGLDGLRGLFVINPDGTGERQLAGTFPVAASVSWSPDSTRLAFATSYSTLGAAVVGLKHGDVHLIGPGTPAWSPDGKWIALSVLGVGINLVHPDGSARRWLSRLDPNVDPPAWAPNSSALAVDASVGATTPDIWVLPLSGSPRRLTQDARFDWSGFDPLWQPAGLPLDKLGGRYVSMAIPTDSVVQRNTLFTTHPITALAADGSSVAINYQYLSEVWNPVSASLARLFYSSSALDGAPQSLLHIALAGGRVAWTYGSPRAAYSVSTATIDAPGRVLVQPNGWSPVPLGDLVGNGSLIVFDSWQPACKLARADCVPGPKHDGTLFRLNRTQAVEIASSAGALTPISVDAGRVLVDHEDGTMDILTADGNVVHSFSFDPAALRGARLNGNDLVVQTPTAIEITDASTGAFQRRWPLPANNATLTDLQSGLAVLVAGSDIHLLRLTDGQEVVIHTQSTGPVLAQLESAGLYYAYSTEDPSYPGRVEFIPYDQLPLR
jgi:Tol biopolymer transport system component